MSKTQFTWPAEALASGSRGVGGVPLVLAVEDGLVRLSPALPGTGPRTIAAWTSRPVDGGPLEAVAGGRIFGVPLYPPPGDWPEGEGAAVWYRPETASLSLDRGEDGLLAGMVAAVHWSLPDDETVAEFRIESARARLDLTQGGHPPPVGADRMAVNVGQGELVVRGGNGTVDDELAVLEPGQGARWTYGGRDGAGRHLWLQWEVDDGPERCPIRAEVLIATEVLRDSEPAAAPPVDIDAVAEALVGRMHTGGVVAGIDLADGPDRTAAAIVEGATGEVLTIVNEPGPELARTSNVAASRKTYKWAVLDKTRGLKAKGRRLLAQETAGLELVLWRGKPGERTVESRCPLEDGPAMGFLDAGDQTVRALVEAAAGEGSGELGLWQIACEPDTTDLPHDFHLSLHAPAGETG